MGRLGWGGHLEATSRVGCPVSVLCRAAQRGGGVTPRAVQSHRVCHAPAHLGNQLSPRFLGDPHQCATLWCTDALRKWAAQLEALPKFHGIFQSSLSAKLYFCPGNTPVMYSFSWGARIRRTLYKACLIKWLSSTKNLVLPVKYSQVRVLILLALCLHYALEEASGPFCLIQGHFANASKMLCLVEC